MQPVHGVRLPSSHRAAFSRCVQAAELVSSFSQMLGVPTYPGHPGGNLQLTRSANITCLYWPLVLPACSHGLALLSSPSRQPTILPNRVPAAHKPCRPWRAAGATSLSSRSPCTPTAPRRVGTGGRRSPLLAHTAVASLSWHLPAAMHFDLFVLLQVPVMQSALFFSLPFSLQIAQHVDLPLMPEPHVQVPVMQSDLSFSLLYGSNLPESIIRAVPALLAEFPAGLLTPAGGCADVKVRPPSQVAAIASMAWCFVGWQRIGSALGSCPLQADPPHLPPAGMVVANPSYAGLEPQLESGLYSSISNGFYHGSVVWGFVEAMMVEGGCRTRHRVHKTAIAQCTLLSRASVPLGGRRPCPLRGGGQHVPRLSPKSFFAASGCPLGRSALQRPRFMLCLFTAGLERQLSLATPPVSPQHGAVIPPQNNVSLDVPWAHLQGWSASCPCANPPPRRAGAPTASWCRSCARPWTACGARL